MIQKVNTLTKFLWYQNYDVFIKLDPETAGFQIRSCSQRLQTARASHHIQSQLSDPKKAEPRVQDNLTRKWQSARFSPRPQVYGH